jgi:hypothetical protein
MTHFNRKQCYKVIELINNNDLKGCIKYLNDNIKTGKDWLKYSAKFKLFLNDILNNKFDNIPFTILKQGNKKLSYLSFSTLPVATCPGAKECLIYCYSLKSWRYPATFFGQCQNTLLMKYNFEVIANELYKYNNKAKLKNVNLDFRLYVDGDFKTMNNLINWMTLLKTCKNIKSYGYSKSKHLFLELHNQGFKYPENYKLNLSNGSKFDFLDNDLLKLDVTRGKFTSFKFDKKVNVFNLTREQKNTIRTNFNNKVFICPGLCDTCTNKGHFCGSNNNLEVVIPVH